MKQVPACLVAVALMAVAAASTGRAQPALQGQLVLRPVTPGDIIVYGLPAATEVSGGLSTVGVGQPVYLEAQVNIAVPASNIVGVTWVLTSKPVGSVAVLTNSPLGTNVPVYEPSDRLVCQVAGRALPRPDVAGQYTAMATITAGSSGTTNVTLTVTAGTYMGINTCSMCHGLIQPNKVQSWQTTAHASIFTKGIDGNLGIGAYYKQSCAQCHTVGYDTNTNAVNGGFDDLLATIVATNGWTFPTVITNGNWAAVPDALKNLANIQCENCHGPGSQHASHAGNTNFISVSSTSGGCNQCHDAPTHHIKGSEWYNSRHAIATSYPSGPGREACVRCHTGIGFVDWIAGATTTNTTYSAINCQTCHEPHGQTIPSTNQHLVRASGPVTFMDGTVVTNAGTGALCMNCHHARQNAAVYAATAAGSARFGPHHGPQGDMLEGVNGFTYGQTIPSSAHRTAVGDTCVTCHMQAETVASTNAAFLQAGSHTFKMSWTGATNSVQMTGACQSCHHDQVNSFDFALQDYNGDGVIEGVQTEVQHLLDKLSTLLPPGGQVQSSLNITTNWTRAELEAAYNWQFVNNDGSKGIHNTAYAVGLLKASIASLTGDGNHDGLPDAWQVQYFGTINNTNAAPNATPAGDGVPNWLKYCLGLDPTKPGISVPGGVVWASGKNLVNPPIDPGDTNAVEIYTAAEVGFNTEVGKTYQIQAISSLSGSWQNVGGPIVGTGSPISYVTPTRSNAQMFFRVVHTP